MKLHFIFALLFLVVQAPVYAADGIPKRDSHDYGDKLVAEFDVPDDIVAKYATHKASKPMPGEPIISMMAGQSVDWASDGIQLSAQHNPYRMVVTVTGSAINDGDAISMWTGGWMNREGVTVAKPMSGLSEHNAKAGKVFMVTAETLPSTFQKDQELAATLGMVKATNMNITAVHVQIWSGVPGTSFSRFFFSPVGMGLLIVLVFLGLYIKNR